MDHDIDTLIAGRLPAWLTGLAPQRCQALRQCLTQEVTAQAELDRLRGKLIPLERFASAQLVKALQGETGLSLDVHTSQLRRAHWRVETNASLLLYGRSVSYSSSSLLAAALHNFAPQEAERDGFGVTSALWTGEGKAIPLPPHRFAELCRRLDIGAAYQQHLREHLAPADPVARAALHTQWEQALGNGFELAVRMAEARGELDAATAERVYAWLATPTADVTVHQLRLLGKPLTGVLALQLDARCFILWVPDDPTGPVWRYPSWAALFAGQAERFRARDYPAFFQQFLREADRPAFLQTLNGLLKASTAYRIELDGRHTPATDTAFVHLRKTHLQKMFDDAQTLAVPTDVEDRAVRDARLKGYLELGQDLLNLVGLFVPLVGAVMVGVYAVQLAKEVYDGYEAWQVGDRQQAVGHLLEVAESLGSALALAGGATVVGKVLARSGLVDALVPLVARDGAIRLADARLTDYQVPVASQEAGSTYAQLGEATFQVEQDTATGQSHIVHPSDAARTPIRLAGDEGHWRHRLEQPQAWSTTTLARRLDAGLAALADDDIDRVLSITGMDAHQLRALHLADEPAPARLVDAAQRYAEHFEEPVLADYGTPVARDFPGLSVRQVNEIVAAADGPSLQRLAQHDRVSLTLAEQARVALREARLDRVNAGFYQPEAVNPDTERLALGLLDELAPWPDGVRVELRDGEAQLLIAHGAQDSPTVLRLNRDGRDYLREGTERRTDLFQALALMLDDTQRSALHLTAADGAALAARLGDEACAQRPRAARLIGVLPTDRSFLAPERLSDGRLGYRLGGGVVGTGRQAFEHALLQLYPTFTAEQVEIYRQTLRSRGTDIWLHLSYLERELEQLDATLHAWQDVRTSDALMRASRRRVAQRIRRCWRRQSTWLGGRGDRLLIEGERIGQLPAFAPGVDFSHVTDLSLRGSTLDDAPDAFLERFPGLRRLDVRALGLNHLPPAVERMPHLRRLDLADNQISFNAGSGVLTRLVQLEHLDLNRNPVGARLDLTGLDRLRILGLRGTGLTHLPRGLASRTLLESADLRDNQIIDLHIDLLAPPRALLRSNLHDNPLSADSRVQLRALRRAFAVVPEHFVEHTGDSSTALAIWLEGSSPAQLVERQAQWDRVAAEPGAQDLLRLLADLTRTADYQSNRKGLRLRVWELINVCEHDELVRQDIFSLAARPRTCGDSVALSFSYLETRAWVAQRTRNLSPGRLEPTLLNLGRRLFRLDEVDRVASDDISERHITNRYYDEVELRLAYRVGLARTLDLPAQPHGMRFAGSANVSMSQLNRAARRVLATEQAPVVLARSLAGRDFWREYLLDHQAQTFADADQPFFDRLEALSERQSDLTDGEYLTASDAIAADRESAREALIERLTVQALARYS